MQTLASRFFLFFFDKGTPTSSARDTDQTRRWTLLPPGMRRSPPPKFRFVKSEKRDGEDVVPKRRREQKASRRGRRKKKKNVTRWVGESGWHSRSFFFSFSTSHHSLSLSSPNTHREKNALPRLDTPRATHIHAPPISFSLSRLSFLALPRAHTTTSTTGAVSRIPIS